MFALGIEYLREYLHLPPEIVPATLRRQPKADAGRARPRGLYSFHALQKLLF